MEKQRRKDKKKERKTEQRKIYKEKYIRMKKKSKGPTHLLPHLLTVTLLCFNFDFQQTRVKCI